jgi:hypothetical protein
MPDPINFKPGPVKPSARPRDEMQMLAQATLVVPDEHLGLSMSGR